MFLFLALLDSSEEQEKFKEIYNNYRHFMWYVANQKLQDEHLAEDAVQEAFFALARHLDKIEDVHSPRTKKFLATIVRSKAVDILRKTKPSEELEEYLSEDKGSADILELDDQYRVIFEYKYLYRLKDDQIGDILGITAKNVNVRYYRARKKLQEMIRKESDRFE